MSLSVISNGTLLFYEVISNEKTTGILLSIAVLAMLIGGSGAVYYYKQAEKSVTPLKESYTLKINKQAKNFTYP